MKQLFYFILLLTALNLFALDDKDPPAGTRRQRDEAPISWVDQQRSEPSYSQPLDPRNQRRSEQEVRNRAFVEVLRQFPITMASLNVAQRIDDDNRARDNVIAIVVPGGTADIDRIFNRTFDLGNTELTSENLAAFLNLATNPFGGQNIMRYVMASTNSEYQILRNVRHGLVATHPNRLYEQIFESGGARIYPLFIGVHRNNLRDLTRMLVTALGGTSPLGLHSGSGSRSGQIGQEIALDASPSTRRQHGSPRSIVRLENLQFVVQQAAFEAEDEFREGVYVITGNDVYLNQLPIVNLNNQRLTDQQIVSLHRFWSQRLNPILGSGIRYIGQVGRGPNGMRILTDRVEEHRLAPIENPVNRRNLALAQMNENGVRGQFHALAYNVHPEDLNVVEALVIHLTHAATDQNGLNSNIGRRSALERVQNAIRMADAENSSETSLEVDERSNTPTSPSMGPPVRRPLFFSRSASAAPAL